MQLIWPIPTEESVDHSKKYFQEQLKKNETDPMHNFQVDHLEKRTGRQTEGSY